MLTDHKGKLIKKYIPDYVVFDLETTGINCNCDDVIEISALKVIGSKVVDEFSTLVNPGISIPWRITQITGIDDAMVKDAPDFEKALTDFIEFADDMVLVGHNICTFDLLFIYRESNRIFDKIPGNDYVDTLSLSRMYLPELKSHRLGDLARHYDIDPSGAHRALADCHMTQKLYEALKNEMENPSEAAKAVKKCPRCGLVMKKRDGRFGPFWGCGGYPDCRYTENI